MFLLINKNVIRFLFINKVFLKFKIKVPGHKAQAMFFLFFFLENFDVQPRKALREI